MCEDSLIYIILVLIIVILYRFVTKKHKNEKFDVDDPYLGNYYDSAGNSINDNIDQISQFPIAYDWPTPMMDPNTPRQLI